MEKQREVQADTDVTQYLTFHIGAEEYALTILRVREIIELASITRVPTMPDCVRGVLNLRGSVLPVVDLAVLFGIPQREITKQTCVIVVDIAVDGQLTTMGILADTVDEVVEFRPDQIEPPPAFGTRRVEYLTGLARTSSGFVMMLDVDCALSAQALLVGQSEFNGVSTEAAIAAAAHA